MSFFVDWSWLWTFRSFQNRGFLGGDGLGLVENIQGSEAFRRYLWIAEKIFILITTFLRVCPVCAVGVGSTGRKKI